MSKHTQGPWVADLGEAYRVRAQRDGGQVAIMMNLKGPHGMGGRRDGDEVAANARLIAAAPDLLAALEAILPDAIANHIGGPDTQARIDAARAAIAKAKGEA